MAATVREAVRELLEQAMAMMDALLAASDRELTMPSSHACAQGKDVWTLITNDIDHEKIHTGQVLEGRYESKITASFHVAKHTLVVAQDFLNTMAADQAARGHSTRG